jgi:hypothetical protein
MAPQDGNFRLRYRKTTPREGIFRLGYRKQLKKYRAAPRVSLSEKNVEKISTKRA